ncbi:MAG: type II 3-dehydroquinate dehydratase [Elusimicrobiota bacterium]
MSEKILVINGPNMDKLGKRDEKIYGKETLDDINKKITSRAEKLGVSVEFFQSSSEGDIVEKINGSQARSLIINPAAFTHTSVALRDSLEMFEGDIIEVHLSNILGREEFRQKSLTASQATGVISGLGSKGYILALDYLAGG